MVVRPTPGLDPTKPQVWTRWLVDWVPPEAHDSDRDAVHDLLIEMYFRGDSWTEHTFRLVAIDKRKVEFGGGAEGAYESGDGIRAVFDYTARGANRHDVQRRVLAATGGQYVPRLLTITELCRVNLDFPVALPFPAAVDFAALTRLVRTY